MPFLVFFFKSPPLLVLAIFKQKTRFAAPMTFRNPIESIIVRVDSGCDVTPTHFLSGRTEIHLNARKKETYCWLYRRARIS